MSRRVAGQRRDSRARRQVRGGAGELRELVQEGAPSAPARSTVERPCPACGGKLTLAVFGSIYMEHCTLCEGIFLDRGELDKAMFVVKARGDEIATIVALARSVVTRGTIGS